MSLVEKQNHNEAALIYLRDIWSSGFIYKLNILILLPQIHQLNMEQSIKKSFFVYISVQCLECVEHMAARSLAVNRQTQFGVDTGGRKQCKTPPDGPGALVNPEVPSLPLGDGSDGAGKYETGSEVAHRDGRGRGRIHSHVRPPLVKESWIYLGGWYCETKERPPLC